MATKTPFMQFYPSDWFADTRILSLATRGAWLDMICAMHVRGTDSVCGTTERLAGLIGCTESELIDAVLELKENDVADIEIKDGETGCNGDVTLLKRGCNAHVTLTCRRLKKAIIEREKTAERVKKFRAKEACNGNETNGDDQKNQGCNGDETFEGEEKKEKKNPPTPPKKQSKEPIPPSQGAPTREEDFFPHSVDEVIELSKLPWCAMKCTKAQAEAYFTDRLAKDWTPYGQSRLKSKVQICADLKKWLMRDQNNQNKTNGKQNGNNNGKRDVRVIANDPGEFDPADDGSNF